jgi:hypothetical protein
MVYLPPVLNIVLPKFQTKLYGAVPLAVVLKVALCPGHFS